METNTIVLDDYRAWRPIQEGVEHGPYLPSRGLSDELLAVEQNVEHTRAAIRAIDAGFIGREAATLLLDSVTEHVLRVLVVNQDTELGIDLDQAA